MFYLYTKKNLCKTLLQRDTVICNERTETNFMQKLIGISYFERNNVTDFISIIMSLQVIIKVRRRRLRPFEVAKSEIDILRKSKVKRFHEKNIEFNVVYNIIEGF